MLGPQKIKIAPNSTKKKDGIFFLILKSLSIQKKRENMYIKGRTSRGIVLGGMWVGGSGWGTCVHPWRIHVDVWQNQYNIAK